MNRRDALLGILGAADGRSFSPVQIQKAAFLVDRNLPEIFDANSRFDFEPYDYGPFDRDVYIEINALEMQGLASLSKAIGRFTEYSATDQGVERANEILDALPDHQSDYIRRVVDWVRSLSFARLVKSIYEEYPDMRANSIFQG
jgi:uncharacterized protein